MFHPIRRRFFQIGLSLVAASSSLHTPLWGDEWKNNAGTKSITGDFVKLDGIKLTIRKEDGTEATIPLYLLDDASRLKARALAKGDKTGALAAGIAAEPLTPVEVTSLSDIEAKFASMQTAEEFMKYTQEETSKGNYVIQWDMIPPTIQVEVENLAREAIGKLEQPALNDILKFKKLVVETFRSKKSYILNSRELELPPEIKPLVELLYDPVVDLVSEAIPDSYFTLETLKSTELRDIFTTIVSNVAPRLDQIASQLPPGMNPKDMLSQMTASAKYNQISATEAEMTVLDPLGNEVSQSLKRVENRWVDSVQLEAMQTQMGQAKASVQGVDSKQLTRDIRQGLLLLNTGFGGLANAESQQDVDDIIKLFKSNMPIPPMIPGGPGMFPQ